VGALWLDQAGRRTGRDGGSNHLKGTDQSLGDHPGSPFPTHARGRQLDAGTSALEPGHASIVIVEPTDVRRAGVARTHFAALAGAGRGRGAAVGRDFTDRQRFTAVLDGGVGLGDVQGPWGGRVGGDGQGAGIGQGSNWRLDGDFDSLLTNC
jgi:hypothetical protein